MRLWCRTHDTESLGRFLIAVVLDARDPGRGPIRTEGFPRQLAELFAFIAVQSIRNAVFLCGDPHLSMTSRIWLPGARIEARCVVASALYAPFPFANRKPVEFLDAGRFALAPYRHTRDALRGGERSVRRGRQLHDVARGAGPPRMGARRDGSHPHGRIEPPRGPAASTLPV